MPYEFIVTLSTIPSKLKDLPATLDSIVNQTLKAKKIILQIPETYDFRLKGQSINTDLLDSIKRKYGKYGLEVNVCKNDDGPGTKLVGLLEQIPLQSFGPNQKIVVLDDDLIYNRKSLEYVKNALDKSSLPLNASFYTYKMEDITVGQGADLFVLEPNALEDYLAFFYKVKNSKDGKFILHHDDVILSYYLNQTNNPVVQMESPPGNTYEEQNSTHVNALHNLQGEYSRDNLNNNVLQKLREVSETQTEGFGTMSQHVTVMQQWTNFLRACGYMC